MHPSQGIVPEHLSFLILQWSQARLTFEAFRRFSDSRDTSGESGRILFDPEIPVFVHVDASDSGVEVTGVAIGDARIHRKSVGEEMRIRGFWGETTRVRGYTSPDTSCGTVLGKTRHDWDKDLGYGMLTHFG